MQVRRSVNFEGKWMVTYGNLIVTDNHNTPREAMIAAQECMVYA